MEVILSRNWKRVKGILGNGWRVSNLLRIPNAIVEGILLIVDGRLTVAGRQSLITGVG